MSYEDQGSGTPVLFIHGGYGGAATTLAPRRWEVRSILPPDTFRVITYDRRCCGLSEYVEDKYTLADLAQDAASLLDHLAIDRAMVIGSSAGGPVALQFALSWPQRTPALCLSNTGANLMNEEREVSRQRHDLVERVRVDGARAVFETRKHRLRTPPATAEKQTGEDAVTRQKVLEAALAACRKTSCSGSPVARSATSPHTSASITHSGSANSRCRYA